MFALNWAIRTGQYSTLVSLDTNLRDQSMRASAILSGASLNLVKKNPEAYALMLDRRLSNSRIFDVQVNAKEIADLLLAEEEFWGSTPALVVVDNVSNIVKDTSYEAFRSVFIELQKVARLRDTVVLALHHVTRDAAKDGRLTLHSGQYSGEQEAEIVLGLWRSGQDKLNVSVLKNRNGRADPHGGLVFPLSIEDSMRIGWGEANDGNAGIQQRPVLETR